MLAAPDVLSRLEWSRVLDLLGRELRTPMGLQQFFERQPLDDAVEIERMQRRAAEMRRLHAERGRLPVPIELQDPEPTLRVLQVLGQTLPGREIYELVRLLAAGRSIARTLALLDGEGYPELSVEWARFPDLEGVISAIDGNLTPSGGVEDHASPELTRIRREIRHLSERLTKILEGILRNESGGPVLQDNFITVRSNRYVLPIRTDAPRRFPGIVHATSASAHTLFIEPMETVEVNNQLVRLRDEEEQEVERILSGYTELLRASREEVQQTAHLIGELDGLESVAFWADAHRAVRPTFAEASGVTLRNGRHPVLQATLASQHPPGQMRPLDVDLPRELRALIISGPNAGGKTVALKTIGLLALMAHAGFPVPADEARLPFFGSIFADIGDEQSISESLSTFSSHVRNLAHVLRLACAPALVLLDEIGTGTDPAEGAALGTAVLEHLVRDDIHVVATTHHAAIKAWAYRADRALNAACDFDEQTLRPTYRLVPGVAGASIGLTMAEQFGLPIEIIEDARRRLDPAGADTAAALDAVRSLASDLDTQRRDIVEQRRRMERELQEREDRRRSDEQQRKEQWALRVEEMTRAFRAEADRMISRLHDSRERRELDKERAARERELHEKFVEEVRAARVLEPPPAAWKVGPGVKVLVSSINKEGIVRAVNGDRAEVRLGMAVFTVPVDDLRPPGKSVAVEPKSTTRIEAETVPTRRGHRSEGVRADVAARSVARELPLLGYRVDEALDLLDKYLDDAGLAGLTEVRVVHGFGTGALKKAVREHLSNHPSVVTWRDGQAGEGGGGATVVTLREL